MLFIIASRAHKNGRLEEERVTPQISNRAELLKHTKNSNTPYARCIDISYYALLLSTHATGCSIFSTVQ